MVRCSQQVWIDTLFQSRECFRTARHILRVGRKSSTKRRPAFRITVEAIRKGLSCPDLRQRLCISMTGTCSRQHRGSYWTRLIHTARYLVYVSYSYTLESFRYARREVPAWCRRCRITIGCSTSRPTHVGDVKPRDGSRFLTARREETLHQARD
jgi:hypothetical protein